MRGERDYLEPPVYMHTCKYLGWDRGTRHATVTRTLNPSSAPLAAQNDGFLTQLGVRYMEVVSLYSSL